MGDERFRSQMFLLKTLKCINQLSYIVVGRKLANHWPSLHQYIKRITVASLQPLSLSFYSFFVWSSSMHELILPLHFMWIEQQVHNLRPKSTNYHRKLPRKPFKISKFGQRIIISLLVNNLPKPLWSSSDPFPKVQVWASSPYQSVN